MLAPIGPPLRVIDITRSRIEKAAVIGWKPSAIGRTSSLLVLDTLADDGFSIAANDSQRFIQAAAASRNTSFLE
jgi:hypothetical protein